MCQLVHAIKNTDVDMFVNVEKLKAYQCETCARIFSIKQLLARHRKDYLCAKRVCGICDWQFEHVQSLSRHVRVDHATGEKSSSRASHLLARIVARLIKHAAR